MWKSVLASMAALMMFCSTASAHFGMVIPSKSVVENKGEAVLTLDFSFSHPMEMQGMPLEKPQSVTVWADGEKKDIASLLTAKKIMGHQAWQAKYTLERPGVYQFVMEPKPYWEPTEDCFIVHYTKTYVAAFGEEEGWDKPLGLKTEIVPLTRPFGNYAGNVFQGVVLLDGKPVPGAEVEVEFYNRDKKYTAPNGAIVTQVVHADQNGVFTYGVPFAGWWGFAALNTAPEPMKYKDEDKPVELGAVVWMEFVAPMKKK